MPSQTCAGCSIRGSNNRITRHSYTEAEALRDGRIKQALKRASNHGSDLLVDRGRGPSFFIWRTRTGYSRYEKSLAAIYDNPSHLAVQRY